MPSNAPSPRGNSVGSLSHDIALAPGEEREIVFVMGATDAPAAIDGVVARFSRPGAAAAALQAVHEDWDAYLARFTVNTPDADTNAMLNVWNQVQCRTTLYWSRFVSGYESGLGRGMGTRDSGQDTLGTMHTVPDHARRTLTTIWRMQFADGHTWHQFYPLTLEGGPGLAAEFPDWPQWFSDDHLWLVIAVCAYLRETGDFGYLDQEVPYVDRAAESVWGHMLRAVEFTLDHRGPHGLPRAGFSDWNDTLNIDHGSGRAESVWTGMQFCRAMLDLVELCEATGRSVDAARFAGLHDGMAAVINEHAWDGAWYARAFDDEGLPIGVAGAAHHADRPHPPELVRDRRGRSAERARLAMQSADEKLNTRFGIALLWPPYDGGDDRVRGTSTYLPGAKENGGIFCHANTWSIVAAAMLGDGDAAYRYYRQILPLARTDSDRYMVEPYTYPQNICGPAHPSFGMARNAWLTGTAAWTFVAATQWILGIRPHVRGPADRAGAAGGVAGLHGPPRVPGHRLRDRRAPRGPGQRAVARRRRAPRRGRRRAAAGVGDAVGAGRGHAALKPVADTVPMTGSKRRAVCACHSPKSLGRAHGGKGLGRLHRVDAEIGGPDRARRRPDGYGPVFRRRQGDNWVVFALERRHLDPFEAQEAQDDPQVRFRIGVGVSVPATRPAWMPGRSRPPGVHDITMGSPSLALWPTGGEQWHLFDADNPAGQEQLAELIRTGLPAAIAAIGDTGARAVLDRHLAHFEPLENLAPGHAEELLALADAAGAADVRARIVAALARPRRPDPREALRDQELAELIAALPPGVHIETRGPIRDDAITPRPRVRRTAKQRTKLLTDLASRRVYARRWAATVLGGWTGDPEIRDALRVTMGHEDGWTRAAAARSLGHLADEDEETWGRALSLAGDAAAAPSELGEALVLLARLDPPGRRADALAALVSLEREHPAWMRKLRALAGLLGESQPFDTSGRRLRSSDSLNRRLAARAPIAWRGGALRGGGRGCRRGCRWRAPEREASSPLRLAGSWRQSAAGQLPTDEGRRRQPAGSGGRRARHATGRRAGRGSCRSARRARNAAGRCRLRGSGRRRGAGCRARHVAGRRRLRGSGPRACRSRRSCHGRRLAGRRQRAARAARARPSARREHRLCARLADRDAPTSCRNRPHPARPCGHVAAPDRDAAQENVERPEEEREGEEPWPERRLARRRAQVVAPGVDRRRDRRPRSPRGSRRGVARSCPAADTRPASAPPGRASGRPPPPRTVSASPAARRRPTSARPSAPRRRRARPGRAPASIRRAPGRPPSPTSSRSPAAIRRGRRSPPAAWCRLGP